MAQDDSDLEKTEEPTHKRIQDAVKKGQVAFSREISNFLVLAVLALNIAWLAPVIMQDAIRRLSQFIMMADDIRVDEQSSIVLFKDTATDIAVIMLVPILIMVFVAFFSSMIQNGIIFSGEPLIPKLEKISVFKGIKRLFSMRSLMEFIKGIIKISLVGFVAYMAVVSELDQLKVLVNYDVQDMLHILGSLALKVTIAACAVMLIIAMLDFMYQKFEYIKSLRMSKQELKEEFKQTEGDPQIKAKLRQIRMDRARRRMMAAVPEADVVIRNPEHYAVALKYDEKVMPAPVVLAMGTDRIALKIIEVAEEHDVPTIRNRPLARALYGSCELDQEIPFEHYQAVAEVIGYVYRLKGKHR